MKVFSLEKFKACDVQEELKEKALENGWPQKDDGMTREEFGSCWSEGWAVDKEEWFARKSLEHLLPKEYISEMLNMKCETTPYQDTATIKGSKLEYHLLPPEQLAGMAEIMNKGEISHVTGYMENNPRHYWNAVFRHLMAIRRGERLDEEGNSHALAIACNGVILDRQIKAGKELRFEK